MPPGGEITGGGTLRTAEREPAHRDIDLDVVGAAEAVLRLAIATLEAAGAPKGSRARLDDVGPVTFGITEGLAIYLNGIDLPAEVYATSDVNDLIDALHHRLDDGRMHSFWQGPRETALYLYGTSVARMSELVVDILAHLPLVQDSRIVPLPHTLPPRS